MNKYQKEYLRYVDLRIKAPVGATADFDADASNIMDLRQGEDITLTKFVVEITTLFVAKIEGFKKGILIELPFSTTDKEIKGHNQRKYIVELDFDDRIEQLIFHFDKDYADPYTITVNYNEADKSKYFAKIEATKRTELLKIVNAQTRKGADFVTVFFQPCNDNYGKSIVDLFLATTSQQSRESNLTFTAGMKVGEFNVESGQFYKSITGLAKGYYAIILKQYSTSNELIIQTEYMFFSI